MNDVVKNYKIFKMLEEFGYSAETIDLRSKSGDRTILHRPVGGGTRSLNAFAELVRESDIAEGPYGKGNDRSDR